MLRKAFIMYVNEDCHEEYIKRHNPIWNELELMFRAHGIHNYTIFLNKETSQLFAYVELHSEELWNKISSTKVCRDWWQYMKDMMQTNQDGSPMQLELPEIFHI